MKVKLYGFLEEKDTVIVVVSGNESFTLLGRVVVRDNDIYVSSGSGDYITTFYNAELIDYRISRN